MFNVETVIRKDQHAIYRVWLRSVNGREQILAVVIIGRNIG